MGLQASSVYVCVLCVLLLWPSPYNTEGQALAEEEASISDMDFNALLKDLRGNKFFTAATVLSLLARPYLRPKITLLIPTDTSLTEAIALPLKDYASLIKFHILEQNLNFKQLRLLPVGTWIPTALPNFKLQVTSNTAANLSLDSAQITKPNLCPSLFSSSISCQGISAILNPKAPKPFIFGSTPPATAPSPPPSTSFPAPIFLPPSFAPTSPPLSTPSLAPSVTPFPSTTSSAPTLTPFPSTTSSAPTPTPFPSTTISPSPSTAGFPSAPSPSPLVIMPSTPPTFTPTPSITPLPTVPSPPSPTPSPLVVTNPPQGTGFSENGASSLRVGATLLTALGAYVLMQARSL